jgi:hypothetical protein
MSAPNAVLDVMTQHLTSKLTPHLLRAAVRTCSSKISPDELVVSLLHFFTKAVRSAFLARQKGPSPAFGLFPCGCTPVLNPVAPLSHLLDLKPAAVHSHKSRL